MRLAALALGSILALPVHASDSVPALGLSVGRSRRVTAKLTFERREAAAGGRIFATQRPIPADDEAIRLSEGVLTAAGGGSARAALVARRHGAALLALPGARWLEKGLALELPMLGAAETVGGVRLRLIERVHERRLAEGEVVTLDAERGLLILHPPERQQEELELAEALRAYDGLRDPQALAQWLDGRAERGPAAAARLLEELAARLTDGAASAEHITAVRRAAGAGAELKVAAAKVLARERVEAARRLSDLHDGIGLASTIEALERLAAEADALGARLNALAAALGVPGVDPALESLRDKARALAARREPSLKGRRERWEDAAAAAGAAVPMGARVPGELCERFLSDSGLSARIEEIGLDSSLDLGRKAKRIRELLDATPLSPESPVASEILARAPKSGLVAASGSLGTRRVVPAERVLEAVKETWSVLWSPAAYGPRKRAREALASSAWVELRALSRAEVSGVLVTRDPASRARGRAELSAVFGELEGFLDGSALADRYVIDWRGRELLPAAVADKRETRELELSTGELKRGLVPPGLSLTRALTAEQLAALAKVARALDDHFGRAVQAEFSISGGRLTVLSAQPLRDPLPPLPSARR